jgi:hypothetical protein
MSKGFLIYEEMRKFFSIYEEAVSHIWLCNCSILNFLIYEKNLIFFFISAGWLITKSLRFLQPAGAEPDHGDSNAGIRQLSTSQEDVSLS